MGKRFRTVVWATGVVGSSALRRVIAHPQLELVGVRVYSDEKAGRDAGELIGLPFSTAWTDLGPANPSAAPQRPPAPIAELSTHPADPCSSSLDRA